jgi:serine protease Do
MKKYLRRFSFGLCVLVGALGFAQLPIARAADENAWLGVYTQNLTESLRKGIGYYTGDGVLVSRVVEGGPADHAGILKGDVIVSVNTSVVRSPDELATLVRGAHEGQTIRVTVVRDSQRKSFDVRLGSRSNAEMSDGDNDRDGDSDGDVHVHHHMFDFPNGNVFIRGTGRGRLGVRIEDLNPDLGDYFGVKDGKGVLVVEVMKDTPAERAGIKAGDVITSVDGHAVSDASDLTDRLSDAEGKVPILVVRKGAKRTIETELEKAHVYRFRSDSGSLGSRTWTFPDKSIRIVTPDSDESKELRDQLRELREELRTLREQLDHSNHD